MRQRLDYRVGPGMTSLLMIFMVLCLATLAILAYASTKLDSTLTLRNVESTTAYYEASAKAQEALSQVDSRLQQLRSQAGGDKDSYAQQVRAAFNITEASEGSEETLPVEVIERIDELRMLRVRLRVPVALDGPRYELTGYQAVNDSDWEAEQSVGYYVPAADDDDASPD